MSLLSRVVTSSSFLGSAAKTTTTAAAAGRRKAMISTTVTATTTAVQSRTSTTSTTAIMSSLASTGRRSLSARSNRCGGATIAARSFFVQRTNPLARTETVVIKSTSWENNDEDEFRPQPKRRPQTSPAAPQERRRRPINQKATASGTSSKRELVVGDFQPGDKVQVEVVGFGPLGASVVVLAHHSHDAADLISDEDPPLATGIILQKEISYFRERRGNVDVVRGEILPAYIERTRAIEVEEDDNDATQQERSMSAAEAATAAAFSINTNKNTQNPLPSPLKQQSHPKMIKLDIGLREFGGKAKTDTAASMILKRLQQNPNGILPLGDKSLPQDVAKTFPGLSKRNFKLAVSALYKQGKVEPGPYTTKLL